MEAIKNSVEKTSKSIENIRSFSRSLPRSGCKKIARLSKPSLFPSDNCLYSAKDISNTGKLRKEGLLSKRTNQSKAETLAGYHPTTGMIQWFGEGGSTTRLQANW